MEMQTQEKSKEWRVEGAGSAPSPGEDDGWQIFLKPADPVKHDGKLWFDQ